MEKSLISDICCLAGREYVSICTNRGNFLKLCMVLGMNMMVSKTTAHKLRETPGGSYAQNPRWLPLETKKTISQFILGAESIVIPHFQGFFLGWETNFWSHFKFQFTFLV